jgi:hypothetical protein
VHDTQQVGQSTYPEDHMIGWSKVERRSLTTLALAKVQQDFLDICESITIKTGNQEDIDFFLTGI